MCFSRFSSPISLHVIVSLLQCFLMCPYLKHLLHRIGFGMYCLTFAMRYPILICCGKLLALKVNITVVESTHSSSFLYFCFSAFMTLYSFNPSIISSVVRFLKASQMKNPLQVLRVQLRDSCSVTSTFVIPANVLFFSSLSACLY